MPSNNSKYTEEIRERTEHHITESFFATLKKERIYHKYRSEKAA